MFSLSILLVVLSIAAILCSAIRFSETRREYLVSRALSYENLPEKKKAYQLWQKFLPGAFVLLFTGIFFSLRALTTKGTPVNALQLTLFSMLSLLICIRALYEKARIHYYWIKDSSVPEEKEKRGLHILTFWEDTLEITGIATVAIAVVTIVAQLHYLG